MKASALAALLRQIAAHDPDCEFRILLPADRARHVGSVIDASHVDRVSGLMLFLRETPVLGLFGERVHWAGMSVPISPDPWTAIGQIVRAVDATRDGMD